MTLVQLAIRHPVLLRRVLTAWRLRSVIVIIWTLSLCVMLPLTVVRSVDDYPLLAAGEMISVCHEHWPRNVSFITTVYSIRSTFYLAVHLAGISADPIGTGTRISVSVT